MKALGTSPNYAGLHESVSELTAAPADVDRTSAGTPKLRRSEGGPGTP